MEHDVAKLIGAPPGYLGHRETHPLISQQKLNAVTSDHSNLSIILFDEVEKAASSLCRLLLGVLDKASLRLGDNTSVNFERSLIFMTSNLGAREMFATMEPKFGFSRPKIEFNEALPRLEAIGTAAVKKRFAPEFVNRLDAVITYRPLEPKAYELIIDAELGAVQRHIFKRLGAKAFRLDIASSAKRYLQEKGTSQEFGARELKRMIHRQLIQPLAVMVNDELIQPQQAVRVTGGSKGLRLRVVGAAAVEDVDLAA
jgi:ATP-dependent Clp protease ATP-binding subunit ClpA